MQTRRTMLLTFALMCPMLAAASQSQQQNDQDEPLKLSTDLVVLDAQVLGKRSGTPVSGLKIEDFTLYEDGVKQRITHFSQDKLPLSIVLLLDVSGSVMPVINRVHDEGIVALKQLKPNDELALMVFGKWADLYQDFTTDRALVARRIGDIVGIGPWIQEGTYINEAVYQAAGHLAKASNPGSRRVIIVITDNMSNQPAGLPHSQAEATASLLHAGASLFGLIVGDFAGQARDYLAKGWILADSIGPFVGETGGVAVQIDQNDAIEKLTTLVERLRTRYSFGYTSKNQTRDGRFRRIVLKISREIERREAGVSIIARAGYYAPGR